MHILYCSIVPHVFKQTRSLIDSENLSALGDNSSADITERVFLLSVILYNIYENEWSDSYVLKPRELQYLMLTTSEVCI